MHKIILLWLSSGQHFVFLNTWMRRAFFRKFLTSYITTFLPQLKKGKIPSFCLYWLWLEDPLLKYKTLELGIPRIKLLTEISAILLGKEVLISCIIQLFVNITMLLSLFTCEALEQLSQRCKNILFFFF